MSAAQDSDGLQVRCPQCHECCAVPDDEATAEILCDCGTKFSLAIEKTKPYIPNQKMIGQFQVIDHLGSGGFGDVWLAKDTILDRLVAVKVARADCFDTSDADIFFREARAAAQLKHPNIVSVHEVGRDGEKLFIVSAFIRGATLGEHLADKRFSAREAAELCATLADGLHHAHESGVVHRDLKPPNIILDLDGVPHIADFGHAKRDKGEVTVTLDGSVVGTPSYMSPEQANGEVLKTDRRTDVYSLGVILFLMLTDELPFRGHYRMLLVQIINDAPPSLRRLERRVPRDLETICLKCLEKRADHRYATAAELGADLKRWLAKEPILAKPPGAMGRLLRWSQRKPAIAALTVVLAIVTFVGSSAFAWQYQKTVTANHELMISQVEGLRGASAEGTRVLLKTLAPFGSQAVPDLREARSAPDLSDSQRTHYAIALLPYDQSEVVYLFNRLPDVSVDEVGLICEALLPHADELKQQLWESVTADKVATSTQLRLATALAVFDPESDDWKKIAKDVVASLTELDQIEARRWARSLLPGRKCLLPEFESLFETSENQSNRVIAAHAMVHFLESDSDQLVELLRIADIRQLPIIVTSLKQGGGASVIEKLEALAQLKPDPSEEDVTTICNAAVTLAQMDRPEVLWSLLESDVTPDVRIQLIHRLAPAGIAPEVLAQQLTQQTSPAVRRGILLALSEYESFQTTSRFRESVGSRVHRIHDEDPDSGVHSAADWLLREWGTVRDSVRQPQSLDKSRNWYVNRSGQTLLVSRGLKTLHDEVAPVRAYANDPNTTERSANPAFVRTVNDRGHTPRMEEIF
jgi:serine/threonine protein kinase